jgi:hypothetical protein
MNYFFKMNNIKSKKEQLVYFSTFLIFCCYHIYVNSTYFNVKIFLEPEDL